jgi:uncharacterized membrane protein YbhN (UPF0104 family)
VNKRTIVNVGKYLLAFGLLAWVITKYWAPPEGKGLRDVWQQHVVEGKPIHGWFLLAALGLFATALLITFVRWYLLVRAQDLPFRLFDAFRLGLVGFFFNTFLPGSIGGDLIKAAVLVREQSSRTRAVSTVIMDRVIALWGLFWFVAVLGSVFWLTGGLENAAVGDRSKFLGADWVPAVLSAVGLEDNAGGRSKFIVGAFAGVCLVSLAVWLLLGLLPEHRAERFAGRLAARGRVGLAASEFWRAVWIYRCRQKSVFLAMGLACVGFVGFVMAYYCAVRVLWDGAADNPIPTLQQHFLLVPVGLIIMAMNPFPGGAGIGELGFGLLYGWFGCAPASGIFGTMVQRVLTWCLGLCGYLVYLRMRGSLPAGEGEPVAAQPSVNGVAKGGAQAAPSGAYTS